MRAVALDLMKTMKTNFAKTKKKQQELLPNVNDRSVLRGSQTDKRFKTKPLKNYTSIKGYKH